MPKPSCSSPAQRSRQSMAKQSATRVDRGQVVVGHPAEEAHRASVVRGEPLESAAVATGAGDGDLQRRDGGRPSAAPASMSTSKPFRGTSRLRPSDHGRVGVEAEPAPGGAPGGGVERVEAVGVDPGRHDHRGQVGPAARRGLRGRVAAGGDDEPGAAQHLAEEARGSPGPARAR